MARRLARVLPLAIRICLLAPLLEGCYGNIELQACTYSDPTFCDGGPGSTAAATGTTVETTGTDDGAAAGGGIVPTTDGPGPATGGTSSTTGGSASTGEPVDLPPSIADLACDPPAAQDVGPTIVTYTASPDAVEADLLDDGVVIASGPAGAPLIFPVTSAPKNNPGSTLTVVVRDAGGQTAQASIYQPSTVAAPGSEVWTTLEQNDGQHSAGGAAALQAGFALAAGVLYNNGTITGTLRRFDQGGQWKLTDQGWSRPHTTWTTGEPLKSGSLGPTALAVDDGQNIILVGTAIILGEPRMYVARFLPDSTLDWELLGNPGTEARGVGVMPDRTIYVAGAVRTAKAPDRWDMATSVYSADKTAHGPDIFKDPQDEVNHRSERGRAVAVMKDGRVVVVGTREIKGPMNETLFRGVALLYEAKGLRVGEWTSSGDTLKHDALLAATATDEGVAVCGYAQAEPDAPTQLFVRWFDETLTEIKAPRLENTVGPSVCNAIGYNRDGATIVGGSVAKINVGDNAWIFSVEDAASPRVDYLTLDGPAHGADRVSALACDYTCAWTGALQVGDALQWVTGMIRG